ncbi:MAG: hypothetical protein GY841_01305 [FCB group bacterium]|nr:hypothetical protein [FCB group bacterium]
MAGSDCDGCKRAGKLEECTADDPMGKVIPKGSDHQPTGDMWDDVTQPSGNYYSGLEAFCVSIKTHLNELFLPDCFGILGTEKVEALRKKAEELGWPEAVIPKNYKQPEYSFDVDFVSGLENQFRERDNRPVVGRLKVSMYFEGNERELVHEWEAEGTLDVVSGGSTSYSGYMNRLRKAYKEGPSITEIIDEFEKRPDDCQMKLEEEVVKLGQVIEIELSDFKDVMGETSREFNRVMLQALNGKILNGMPSKYSDGLRIFPVGEEPIKIKYQAPDSCYTSTDSLIINSTCDILDEEREPYADTELDEQIQSKAIPLFCPGVYAIMTVTQKKSSKWDKKVRGKIDRKDWNQTTSLTVRVDFDKEPAEVRQSFDLTTMTSVPDRYRYKPVKWTINSPQHSGSGSSLQKKEGGNGIDFLLESSSSETGVFTNLRPTQSEIMLTIDVDPATGKAMQVSVPAYEADLNMTTTKKCTKKERRMVDGYDKLVTEDCSDSWKHESTYSVGHAEDECWEISGGDGISSISGECQRRIDRDNGYEEIEFRWSITIQNES